MTDHPPSKRADAARHRQRILDAARAAFADGGPETSMSEIARRAGVGPATLDLLSVNRTVSQFDVRTSPLRSFR